MNDKDDVSMYNTITPQCRYIYTHKSNRIRTKYHHMTYEHSYSTFFNVGVMITYTYMKQHRHTMTETK